MENIILSNFFILKINFKNFIIYIFKKNLHNFLIFLEWMVKVLVSIALLVWTMHNICKARGSSPDHHKKKKRMNGEMR